MPRFEHDGISHYYTDQGAGFPLVFIHGQGLSHQNWIGQVPVFARQYRIITYDVRGHGGTGISKGSIEVRDYSEDLRALFDVVGIEKAVLIAYSSGTLIAEQFALDYSDKVAGLCLIGSHAKVKNTYFKMKMKSQMGRWMINTGLQKALAYSVARNNAENLLQRGFFYRIAKRVNPEEALRFMDACERFVSTKQVAKLKCPVLLVHGTRDRATEAYAREFVKQMPHVQISVVERCNHAVATRAIGVFNAILQEWLTGLNLPCEEKELVH